MGTRREKDRYRLQTQNNPGDGIRKAKDGRHQPRHACVCWQKILEMAPRAVMARIFSTFSLSQRKICPCKHWSLIIRKTNKQNKQWHAHLHVNLDAKLWNASHPEAPHTPPTSMHKCLHTPNMHKSENAHPTHIPHMHAWMHTLSERCWNSYSNQVLLRWFGFGCCFMLCWDWTQALGHARQLLSYWVTPRH